MGDGRVGMPCGACRELLMQLHPDSPKMQILVDLQTEKSMSLQALMPDWWGKDRMDQSVG